MSATTADSLVGEVLDGRYRVVRRLARGGMSTVYVGHDERLDRAVAIKVMSTDLARDEAFTRRFTREARAAAKIWHPNVVAVHDQGSDPALDAVFLVMELVHGHTVRDLLRERGTLSAGAALAVVEPLLTGLAAAHAEGLVHRDIKPENVLISDTGRVLVVDFGLARAVAESSHTTHSGLGGTVFGTVAYLSPEQVRRGFADARSDVYAVGTLLYELLTGSPPYVGDNAVSVAYRHVNDDVPPPSAAQQEVPGEVDDLVIAATNRDPGRRPEDAGAMLVAVREVQRRLGLDTAAVPLVERQVDASDDTDPADSPTPAVLEDDEIGSAALTTGLRGGAAAEDGRRITAEHEHRTNVRAEPGADQDGDALDDEPVPAYVRRITRRRKRWVLPLVAAALVLALVGGAAFWWLQYGRWTQVPDFAQASSAQQVTAIANDAGVDVEFGSEQFSENIDEGEVIAAEPRAGARVQRGTDVKVVLSKGPERYTVSSSLIGVPTAEVLSSLKQRFGTKITITQSTAFDDVHAKDTVSDFVPSPGTAMKPGTTLVVVISSGPTPIAVPDVTGKTPDEATALLAGGKFTAAAAPTPEFSDTVPEGSVVRTDPAAGQMAQPGSTVTFVTSKGQDLVEVPNVVGKKVNDAVAILQQAGFAVTKQVVFLTLGVVADQTPNAGEKIKRGSPVTISVV